MLINVLKMACNLNARAVRSNITMIMKIIFLNISSRIIRSIVRRSLSISSGIGKRIKILLFLVTKSAIKSIKRVFFFKFGSTLKQIVANLSVMLLLAREGLVKGQFQVLLHLIKYNRN